jgi:hypothetical protein
MAASIVAIVDRSGSMVWGSPNSLLTIAKTYASSFLSSVTSGDSIAVISFETGAAMVYPSSQSLVTVTGGPGLPSPERAAASAAIQGIQLGGGTNMSAAITIANSLLLPAAAPKGAVLVSDGEANFGLLPPTAAANANIRLFTIGLGQISSNGQTQLANLATATGGKYYYAPKGVQLALVYYDIVGAANISAVVANNAQAPGPLAIQTFTVPVSTSLPAMAFAVCWEDPACQFSPNTPVGNQVNVSLQDPSGNVYSAPTDIGTGYCTFEIPNPPPGIWTFATWCGQTNAFAGQAGLFERNASIQLDLAATRNLIGDGGELEVAASVTDGGAPLTGVSVRARLRSPAMSVEDAVDLHGERLAAVPLDEDRPPPADALDTALRRARILSSVDPDFELVTYGERFVPHVEEDKGTYVVGGTYAEVRGSHTVEVEVSGYSPISRSHFRRTSLLSVVRE